jgi:hypothetical protein
LAFGGSDEINPGLLKAEQEMRVAAEPINLRNDQLGTIQAARFKRLRQHWAVIVLAALDFDELLDQLPSDAVEVTIYSRPLRFQATVGMAQVQPQALRFVPIEGIFC